MKILLVTDYFQPGNSRVQQQHLRHLADRGHEVHLLAGHEHPPDIVGDIDDRITPHLFKYDPEQWTLFELAKIVPRLRSLQQEVFQPELPELILYNQPLTGWLTPDLEPSLSFYVHHAPWHEEWEAHQSWSDWTRALLAPYRALNRFARRWIEGDVLEACSDIVVLSSFMKDKVTGNHPAIDPERVHKIPGGVDPEQFRPPENRDALREEWNIEPKRTVILSVRRLVARMGLDRLIDTVVRYREHHPERNPLLIIAGDGAERERLEERAGQLPADGVRFTGYLPEPQLPEIYRVADVFVLPTRELEGFGLVTLEALASGVPVVGTPVGGTREILEPFDEELLLPKWDADRWAKKLKQVLDSDRVREEYREQCRQYAVEHFSWEEGVDLILSIAGERRSD